MKYSKAEIAKQMTAYHCTEKEAIELLDYDKAVDRGTATEYDYTPEQKKFVKTLLKSNTPRTRTEKKPREKKENPTKKEIISVINQALSEKYTDVSVENDERIVNFTVNGEKFSVTLTLHREKKS